MTKIIDQNLSFSQNIDKLKHALKGVSDTDTDDQVRSMAVFMEGTGNALDEDHLVSFSALKHNLISKEEHKVLWDIFVKEPSLETPLENNA